MDMAQTLRQFLQTHRRVDGWRWTGAHIERTTRGRVSRFYVSRLKRGRIKDPSSTRIVAISRVMGIPLEDWVEVLEDLRSGPRR